MMIILDDKLFVGFHRKEKYIFSYWTFLGGFYQFFSFTWKIPYSLSWTYSFYKTYYDK